MQFNAWQRSCVTGPAIKKPKGQGEREESWEGRRRRREEEGKGGGRGGVCFSSEARQQSEADVEKPGNGKVVQNKA